MPNLVGTGLNQVPSNSMLGGMAYQNPDRVKIKKLHVDEISQINSEIADTATDIFIYDTSKDSDGGAWRKRTSHTSWYNETLGTATRGTRREFPAVAVLVLEASKLTIYDGDDPDLPMWMVFNKATNYMLFNGSSAGRKVEALNGHIVLANSDALFACSFIDDRGYLLNNANTYESGNILGRNSGYGYNVTNSVNQLISSVTNDVAMTVLPNTPVDSATGLPVPTIAVATDSGVSVIKDDGSVSDLYRSGNDFANSVQFTDNNSIMLVWGHASDAIRHINHYSYADWQSDQNDLDQSTGYHELPQFGSAGLQSPLKTTASGIDSGVLVNLNGQNRMSAKWDDYGLKIADLNDSDRANGMVCHIRSDSNTGWMHGDCKGAFLSDTDTTNITSGEILSNGDFTNGTTGWTVQDSNQGTISVTNNQLTLNNTTIADPPIACYQQISLEVGKYYNLTSVHVSGNIAVINITTGLSDGGGTGGYGNVAYHDAAGTTRRGTFLATHSTMYCYIRMNTNATGNTVMNSVSIRKAEADRSINSAFLRDKVSALTIHGTITKGAVATGADLVAYSGFSDSNYFEQPFNSAMQFGSTGDFSVSFWMKQASPATFCGIIDNGYNSSGNFYFLVGTDSNGRLFFRISDSSGQSDKTASSNGVVTGGEWKHIVCTRTSSGTQINMFINGVLDGNSGSVTARNVTNSLNQPLKIGNRSNSTNRFFTGSLALVRVSGSAPSPEQIKKMYEDEKHLYVENSKATLYGSSDNVTAIAYDEVTEQLHVGISSGRSDFQGLRRINNTTTAVTTAISAHDEFIIEQ